jgi:cell division control protein 6
MAQRGLSTFFENFLKKESLFINKKALQSSFIPEAVSHRDQQIEQLANILAPALKLETPSNVFVYGKTGTGKTLTVAYVTGQMADISAKRDIPLKTLYINCKMKRVADTEYRLVAQLARDLGKAVPPTGLPTDEVYKIFFSAVDRQKSTTIIVLDEIDQLVKKTGDEVLYNFTRMNPDLKNSQVALVGISNDIVFADNLDPRIKSSLSEEEVVFPPYNALQLQSILRERARQAFREGGLAEGVIEKCSAYAAREHGDARRALELLRVSAEIAERENSATVTISHIDAAQEKIERERLFDLIAALPRQTQLSLYSIILLEPKPGQMALTGEVYETYKKLCHKTNMRPLTVRRISDILNELDMHGVITTKTISKGRYGRMREIGLALPSQLKPDLIKVLEDSLEIQNG